MQWGIQIFWYEGTINTFSQRKSLTFVKYQSISKWEWGSTIQVISAAVLGYFSFC